MTTLGQTPRRVYAIYQRRGDVENRLKELHYGLGFDRTSCTAFWANAVRVVLTAACQRACNNPHLRASKFPHPSPSGGGGATMAELNSSCSTLPGRTPDREAPMLREALWEEIHRLHTMERQSKAAIARALDLDRKTVRACLAQPAWTPYQRPPVTDTLLTAHQTFLETRAPAVRYSA